MTMVYAIYASPSKGNHYSHEVAVFPTRQNAERYLPLKESYDHDDGVSWYYSIRTRKANSSDKLDVPPPNYFPYTGY